MSDHQTVLMVDDDHDIVYAACMRLRAAGYSTLEASDGNSGVTAAIAAKPDLILLDMRMPHKDGLATLMDLKRCSETKNTPVIVLSASILDQDAALKAGASFFIRKPYSGATLIRAVRTAIDMHTTAGLPMADGYLQPSQSLGLAIDLPSAVRY